MRWDVKCTDVAPNGRNIWLFWWQWWNFGFQSVGKFNALAL